MKRNYELLFILPGTLTENEVAPTVEKVKAVLVGSKAENIQVTDMGKSRLAYPIKHIRYGYFEMARFEAESTDLAQISNKLRLMSELLRVVTRQYNPNHVSSVNKIVYTIEDVLALPRREGEREMSKDAREGKERVAEVATESTEKIETTPVVDTDKKVEGSSEQVVEEKKEKAVKTAKKSTKKVVDLADIDKKLDQILDIDISNV